LEQADPVGTKQIFEWWCLFLFLTLVGVLISIRWIDIPVATHFLSNIDRFAVVGHGLGSSILVAGEMTLITGLAVARIIQGHLSQKSKALFIACCASLSAFAANDYVLKILFGRPNPFDHFVGAQAELFHYFKGDQHSSFPSGHMVIATAFAVTLIRLYPKTWPLFFVLLSIANVALVVGDWHFVSDTIAGFFVGGTAGFIAGELWLRHCRTRNEDLDDRAPG
jgi:membrane-associated phospholipid phosphatase